MARTKIEWAERVWNPVTGCTPVSEGCKNCYAKRMALRLQKMPKTKLKYRNGFKPTFHSHCLVDISPREKPALIFVGSMSDIFHADIVPFDIDLIFARMNTCAQHRFMVLTKRSRRMLEWLPKHLPPLPNVALGVSVENQERAEERMPLLFQCPAKYRFISVEPMLGPVDITYLGRPDLVICGGESGPGARMMHPDWVRSLRDQCATFEIPFCFKQWGKYGLLKWKLPNGEDLMQKLGKKKAGRLLDGKLYDGKIEWNKTTEI